MPKNEERINWLHSTPFILIHLAPILAIWTGTRWTDWVLCLVLYYTRMFFLTAGFHRYFAHRSYKTGRIMQFLLAFGGGTAAQKGVLWWAAIHRHHHKYSDRPEDAHSPIRGFWWSHMVWFLSSAHKATQTEKIKDFASYPELRWLNRHWLVPPSALAIACWAIGGMSAMLIGFMLSTVLLWHGVFTINSLAHLWGRRRYRTEDDSRNNAVLAVLTMGEGWHNNHHHLQTSARQGFYWWEIDVSWYLLKLLSWLGLVWDLYEPKPHQLARDRLVPGEPDLGKENVRKLRAAWKKTG